MPSEGFTARGKWIAASLLGLLFVYIFQRINYFGVLVGWLDLGAPTEKSAFIVNRAIRMIVNDLLCICLINQFFQDPRFSRLAWWVFLAELLVLFPAYLVLKLNAEGPTELSSPLFQSLHRMIVNPLLMIILMAGMYYQRWRESL